MRRTEVMSVVDEGECFYEVGELVVKVKVLCDGSPEEATAWGGTLRATSYAQSVVGEVGSRHQYPFSSGQNGIRKQTSTRRETES
jgi:hypothetical protein